WKDRRPGPGRGKGLACGWWTTTGGSSGVYVKINPDGTVALNTGAAEIGTAAITGAAQVLAEELGIDLTDISVVAADTFSTPYDTKRVEGHVYPAFHSPSFHAHAVDLSVDPQTGEVTIHKYVVAQDVGFAINPTYIEGQIEGGVAQGLGQTLSEEIIYEGGR